MWAMSSTLSSQSGRVEWPKPGCEGAMTRRFCARRPRKGSAAVMPCELCRNRIGAPLPRSRISRSAPAIGIVVGLVVVATSFIGGTTALDVIRFKHSGRARAGPSWEMLLVRGRQSRRTRGLRFGETRQHFLREQLGRRLADVPGLAVPFAEKAQMQVIDAHIRQLLHLGGDRVGRAGDGGL